MPRRRAPQPPTPENLPPFPAGAFKKAYYPSPDTVYFLRDTDDSEWSRGTIHESTTSTALHYVQDDSDGQIYSVSVQYIPLAGTKLPGVFWN